MNHNLAIFVCAAGLLCLAGCRTASPQRGAFAYDTYQHPAQLLAMPSCDATVTRNYVCGATLKSKRGRTFTVGGPGSPLGHFVKTLEKGETYRLPVAYMTFRNNQNKKPNKAIDRTSQ